MFFSSFFLVVKLYLQYHSELLELPEISEKNFDINPYFSHEISGFSVTLREQTHGRSFNAPAS